MLVVMLGGRAAEKLIYQETTAGAENDLERRDEHCPPHGDTLGDE